MQIPLINEHLFCKYFVRLSVGNATKALLLMDVFILVFIQNSTLLPEILYFPPFHIEIFLSVFYARVLEKVTNIGKIILIMVLDLSVDSING